MMKEKIEECFNALQGLEIKATPRNVSVLDGVFSLLREVYSELEGMENAGCGAAANPDGRDAD